jgi:Tol biopolymer transport system component
VRDVDSGAVVRLADTEGAVNPFWSPDSRWIGFFAGGKLRKIEAAGGSAQIICNAPNNRGGTWSQTGIIVFAREHDGPLYQIPDSGGEPKPVTELDVAHGENSHRWPHFLPDGRHFLYLSAFSEAEKQGLSAGSLDSMQGVRLGITNSSAAYAGSPDAGSLLFLRQGRLMAQPFDPAGLRTTGEARLVAEPVGLATGWQSEFSVSKTNVLVYRSNDRVQQEVVLYDRRGAKIKTLGDPAVYLSISLAPDERRAAVRRNAEWPNPAIDIWLVEMATGSMSRFTFNRIPPPGSPVWKPGGEKIVFSTSRHNEARVYEKAVAAPQTEETLTAGDKMIEPDDCSPDGRWILYQQYDAKTRWDLWALPL